MQGRKSYLKTLSDQLINKAQSDILLINRHEAKRTKITLPVQLMMQTQSKVQPQFHQTLNFQEDESVNIIGDGELFYKLDCRDKQFPLRITFRKVKGQLRFMASFKHKYPNSQQADYNFVIEKQIRRALPARLDCKDTLYICFSSIQEVGMAKIYVDSYIQQMQKVARARQSTQTQSSKVIRSISLDKNIQNIDEQQFENNKSYRKVLLTPINRSKEKNSSKQDFLSKNKSILQKYKQASSQKMIRYRQKQQQKFQQNKQRRQQIQKYKQKNRQLKLKASQSKELIEYRKTKIKQEIGARSQLVKNLAITVEICKFFAVLKDQKQKYCRNLKTNAKITHFQSSLLRKLKSKMKHSKQLIPVKLNRDKVNLKLSLQLIGWALQNKNNTKIQTNIGILLSNYSLASKTNNILWQATEYRRKIRYLQKFWKLKYQTRLQMIEDVGKKHIKSMISQFKQFKDVEIDFEMKGILRKITIQYIKDTTVRFNFAYLSYFKKLDTLDDIEKMNKNISQQNLKLAKRNQKPLLRMPVIPTKPFPKYFRDLDSYKSMLRAWFQLESKKYQKKHKKQISQQKQIKKKEEQKQQNQLNKSKEQKPTQL